MKGIGERNNMEEWILGDLTQRKIGYGIVQPGEHLKNGVPVVKVNNLVSGLRNVSDLDTTSIDIDNKYNRTKLLGGELIISVVGTIGRTAIVPPNFAGCNLARAIALIDILNPKKTKWVKYYIDSPKGQHYLKENLNTTVQPTLNIKSLVEMPIPVYSDKYMSKAVDILSSLDDKIELNNRINANLEEQAQTLFHRWFVDFEFPNEEGLPYKSNGGKFVESELGRIPKGWKVGTISEIIESTLGGDWGKEFKEGNYTREVFCIRGADIPDIKKGTRGKMPIRYILEKNFLNKSLESEDLVVEISGGSPTQSTGRVCRISTELLSKYKDSLICTNFCRAIKPKVGFSSYISYLWEYLYSKGVMFTYENGTTGIKNLDMNRLIQKELIVIPNKDILKEFSILVNSINKIIQSNGKESENLSSLRDSLLPQLMNNQIKI